jgi:hypothetical protein
MEAAAVVVMVDPSHLHLELLILVEAAVVPMVH